MFDLTRKNVLSDKTIKKKFDKSSWWKVKAPHDNEEASKHNLEVFKSFWKKYEHKFTNDKHRRVELSLKQLYQDLISEIRYTRQNDSTSLTTIKAVISSYRKKFVYLMGGGNPRERSLTKQEEINELFEGRRSNQDNDSYKGDATIKEKGHISVQLHNLKIKETPYKNVVGIAIWTPSTFNKTFVIQPDQA